MSAQSARRIEATQRVIAIQRFGNAATTEPTCTQARLAWRASRRLAEVEQATAKIWLRMWRRLLLALRRRARSWKAR